MLLCRQDSPLPPVKSISRIFYTTLIFLIVLKDINVGGPVQCGPYGRCVNLVGTYECHCQVGFEMIQHSETNKTCVDLNECENNISNPCLNGDCINESPGYSCSCYPGYHEINRVCVDSNECEGDTHPCGSGDCINTDGSYECVRTKVYFIFNVFFYRKCL